MHWDREDRGVDDALIYLAAWKDISDSEESIPMVHRLKKRPPVWRQLVLSSLIALSCATEAWSRPKVFSDYSFNQAKQQAQQAGKLLVIDFTATWCPPCKKMDSETWTDDTVQRWIKENAIAVQIDVDKDEKMSSELKINSMPTLVLFTPQSVNKEFGRQVGYITPSELMRWLEGAKSGKSVDEVEKEQSQFGENSIWERISKARQLLSAKQNAEALEEYIWLWSNIGKASPMFADLRVSLLPGEMKTLSAVHPPARLTFSEMRDAAEQSGNRQDWILLNAILDDNARTLAWFDKAKTDPKQLVVIEKHTVLLEPILYSNSRWGDAANFLYSDPLAKINQYYQRAQDMKKPRPHTEFAKDFDPFPSMVLLLYGAYIGAGREAEAQKIESECLRLDDTQGMREALNNMAKGMRAARDARSKAAK